MCDIAGITQIEMMEYFSDQETQTVIDINITGMLGLFKLPCK